MWLLHSYTKTYHKRLQTETTFKTTNAYKRLQTTWLQTYYAPILRGTTNGDKLKTILQLQSNNKCQQTGLLYATIGVHYNGLQMPTNMLLRTIMKVTTNAYKSTTNLVRVSRPTTGNKQIVNFFIIWDSPILRPELWATLVPLVTAHNDTLDACPTIKFRSYNRAECTEKGGNVALQTFKESNYKHLQTVRK